MAYTWVDASKTAKLRSSRTGFLLVPSVLLIAFLGFYRYTWSPENPFFTPVFAVLGGLLLVLCVAPQLMLTYKIKQALTSHRLAFDKEHVSFLEDRTDTKVERFAFDTVTALLVDGETNCFVLRTEEERDKVLSAYKEFDERFARSQRQRLSDEHEFGARVGGLYAAVTLYRSVSQLAPGVQVVRKKELAAHLDTLGWKKEAVMSAAYKNLPLYTLYARPERR